MSLRNRPYFRKHITYISPSLILACYVMIQIIPFEFYLNAQLLF